MKRQAEHRGSVETRDDSDDSSSHDHDRARPHPSQKKKGNPLRRGDACLMCRAKKLKCSATKPSCDQCAKRKDRCVYDAVRPASRVEKLERKLAEMEEEEMRVMSRRRTESVQHQNPPYPFDPQLYDSPDHPGYPPSHNGYLPPISHDRSNSSSSGNSIITPAVADWAYIDPFAGAVTSVAQPDPAVQLDNLPWPLLSASNDASTMWGPAGYTPGDHSSIDPLAGLNVDNINMDPSQLVFPPHFASQSLNQQEHQLYPFANQTPSSTDQAGSDVLQQMTSHGSGPLTEKDFSQPARDYLLDLFFSPPRPQASTEVWSEAQFKSRMALPGRQQPHPCLLFGIYTLAASASYIPSVRALADPLYAIACAKLEEAISQEDRLLDAINTTKMLAKWLFTRARPLDAYSMSWRSVSLVLACQLDRIPTGIFSQIAVATRGNENPWPILGPPKNQWDLTERIHAFWGVWGTVRGSSIMLPWPTPFQDHRISTPLPYSPYASLDGTVEHLPDITLRDLYDMPHGSGKNVTYPFAILMAVTHLLHRAKSLRTDRPETNPTYRSDPTQSSGESWFCARRDFPKAYTEIMDTVNYIHVNLPEELHLHLRGEPAWSNPEAPLVNICLIATRMHLHDITPIPTRHHPLAAEPDVEFDRETCLEATRQASAIIKVWLKHIKTEDAKIQQDLLNGHGRVMSSRHKNGIGGPYVLVPWFWTAERLIKGGRVLRKLGRDEEALSLTEDAGIIIAGLKEQGAIYPMAPEPEAIERG